MDRLSMAIALIQEAQEEKKRLAEYNAALEEVPPYDHPDHWRAWDDVYTRFRPTPKKSVINDNLKTARRLLIAEYVREV